MAKKFTVTMDAAEPRALGSFWAFALDYVEEPPPDGFADWDAALTAWQVPDERRDDFYAIVDPDGVGPRIFIQRVPEPKTAKNRVHLDVVSVPRGADGSKDFDQLRAAAARLIERGASLVREFDDDLEGRWIVMHDPEGNEFCVV